MGARAGRRAARGAALAAVALGLGGVVTPSVAQAAPTSASAGAPTEGFCPTDPVEAYLGGLFLCLVPK